MRRKYYKASDFQNPVYVGADLGSFFALAGVHLALALRVSVHTSLPQSLAEIVLYGCTCLGILLGLHQLFAAGTAVWFRHQGTTSNEVANGFSVAVLYTTMNDFREWAALSCVEQKFKDFPTCSFWTTALDRNPVRMIVLLSDFQPV